MIRIVTCLDFETDDPYEAYTLLREAMKSVYAQFEIDYETTDEWYDADGEPIDLLLVENVRNTTLGIEYAKQQ
jgi:hypothetical protein